MISKLSKKIDDYWRFICQYDGQHFITFFSSKLCNKKYGNIQINLDYYINDHKGDKKDDT